MNPVYKDSLLEAASKAAEEFHTLENDKIKVVFTSKGAQASQVLVKDYYTHDSLDLYLIRKNASQFAIDFYTDQQLSTADFNFTKVAQTDSSIVMRLPYGENAYIDHIYTLSPDSYMMDFKVKMVGMDRYISKGAAQVEKDMDTMKGILDAKKGSWKSMDGMKMRFNVFSQFIPKPVPTPEAEAEQKAEL